MTTSSPLLADEGQGPSALASDVGRNSAVIAVATMVSRVTGLLRVVVTAAVLGPTYFGNVFQTTNLLPYVTYSVLAGSLMSALLVPPLVRAWDQGDSGQAARVAGGFLGTVLTAGLGLGVLATLAGPILSRPLVAAMRSEDHAAAARHVAFTLLIIVVPQVLLMAVAGVGVAAQNSRNHFALAAMAPTLENLGVITTLGLSGSMFGTGVEVESVTNSHLAFLVVGTTLSVGVHALAQWWGARRAGILIRPRVGWRDPEVRKILRLVPASIGTTAITAGRFLAASVVASRVQGGVVALQMALNFYNLPVAIGASPVGVAAMPTLARLAHGPSPRGFIEFYNRTLRLAWFLLLPAGAAFVVVANPIARAVAFGEMRSPGAIALIAVSLSALGLAVIGEGTLEITRRACYANRDARRPLSATIIRGCVAIIGFGIATQVDGRSALICIGLTFSVGDLVSAWWLDRQVRRSSGQANPLAIMRSFLRLGLVSSVMAPLALVAARLTSTLVPDGTLDSLSSVTVAAAIGMLSYVLIQRAVRSPELAELLAMIRSRGESSDDVSPVTTDRSFTTSRLLAYQEQRRTAGTALGVAAALYAAVAAAVAAGAIGALGGMTAVAVAFAGTGLIIVAARPELAAYTYVACLPFLAGIPRGHLVPFLRPTEILQLYLTFGLLLRVAVFLLDGRRLALTWTKIDVAFVLFATAGSVVPIAWMLVRGLPVTRDDLLSTIPIWKYYGLYVMIRMAVRTASQVRNCLIITVAVALVTGIVATFQALNLFWAPEMLALAWADEGKTAVDLVDGRGSGFLGSPIATVTFVVYNLAVTLSIWIKDQATRAWTTPSAVVLVVCAFGVGQITGIAALAIVVMSVGRTTGRLREMLRSTVILAPVAVALVWPVVDNRLNETYGSTRIPQSWVVRWDNLTTFYWPHLGGLHWMLGVRPDSIIEAPETWRDVIYLESGYTWLLWVGGIPLLVAFIYFEWTSLRALHAVTQRADAIGCAAVAATAALIAIATLATIDMHITTRGEADIAYVLLGLSFCGPTTATQTRGVLL